MFTPRARETLRLAAVAAKEMKHDHIGTSHILLGLLQEEKGLAAEVLRAFKLDPGDVRSEVHRLNPPSGTSTRQLSARARAALLLAQSEARQLGHTYIGTEHVLLGLTRSPSGGAAAVLSGRGLSLPAIREALLEYMGFEARPS